MKRRGMRGRGWGSEGCERVELEKGGVGEERGMKRRSWRVWLEEERGVRGWGWRKRGV